MRENKFRVLVLLFVGTICVPLAMPDDATMRAATTAYQNGEYQKAIDLLKTVIAKDSNNGDAYLLLTKAYLQSSQVNAAVSSAEQAVAINPNNSVYHDWLGQAYGEKASHASMLSAYPLARKTQKEFETAVQLDERNFEAAQNLVEYDCTAPGIVGGGEDKAAPIIQKLMALDAAQGHYAQGTCRLKKNDTNAATTEFTAALESKPQSAELIFDIASYFAAQQQGNKVSLAVHAAEAAAPSDTRLLFYRGAASALGNDRLSEGEKNLRDYLERAPKNPDYPALYSAHYFLGRIYELEKNFAGARAEYESALKLNPKSQHAQEGLKRLANS